MMLVQHLPGIVAVWNLFLIPIYSTSNTMLAVFHSDGSVNGTGFQANYTACKSPVFKTILKSMSNECLFDEYNLRNTGRSWTRTHDLRIKNAGSLPTLLYCLSINL